MGNDRTHNDPAPREQSAHWLDEWPAEDLEHLGRCPVCKSTAATKLYDGLRDLVFFSAPGGWTFHECQDCGSGYIDPRPTAGAIALAYRTYYTHSEPTSEDTPAGRLALVRRALRNGYLNSRYGSQFSPAWMIGSLLVPLLPCGKQWADRRMRHLRPSGQDQRILDVGCGNGVFLLDMRAASWTTFGLDPDPDAVAAARAAGVPVEQGVLEEATFPKGHFAAITLNHVIEHLHDPREALRICRDLLVAAGTLWIATPNFASTSHQVFGRHWRGLEPPRHLAIFTSESLETILTQSGFHIVSWRRYCGARAMFEASARIARLSGSTDSTPPSGRGVGLKALVADARGFLWPRLGEELIVVARKRSGTVRSA